VTRRGAIAESERVFLRRVRASDRDEFLARVRDSAALHHPWSDPPRTPDGFDTFLRRSRRSSEERLLVCRTEDRAIVGQFGISQIFYGSFRSAYLGYYVFVPFSGEGYMRDGLRLILRHAFGALELHRLQANIQPANATSIALVRRAGFKKEGLARRYLMIDGEWRDHQQWAILAEDVAAASADGLGPRAGKR
jgi:[ribosomal protein S5]-alanine N-acetyltransferase